MEMDCLSLTSSYVTVKHAAAFHRWASIDKVPFLVADVTLDCLWDISDEGVQSPRVKGLNSPYVRALHGPACAGWLLNLYVIISSLKVVAGSSVKLFRYFLLVFMKGFMRQGDSSSAVTSATERPDSHLPAL